MVGRAWRPQLTLVQGLQTEPIFRARMIWSRAGREDWAGNRPDGPFVCR